MNWIKNENPPCPPKALTLYQKQQLAKLKNQITHLRNGMQNAECPSVQRILARHILSLAEKRSRILKPLESKKSKWFLNLLD